VRISLSPVLASLVLAFGAAPAAAQVVPSEFRGHERQVLTVVEVQGLTVADLPELAPEGAIGLMVPSAGPETSGALAFSGMVRGVLHNARLGPRPDGPVLIHVEKSLVIPPLKDAIIVGLPPGQPTPNDRRYPIAVLGPCHGVLTSSLTRVRGLVSIADVARTALQSPHALACSRDGNAVATLERLEQRIETARSTTMLGTVIVMAIAGLLALFLPGATLAALAAALGANLALGFVPLGGVAMRLTLLGVLMLAGGIAGRRLFRDPLTAGAVLTGLVATYGVAMAAWPAALSLAPLSPELTSRFYGVSNLVETLLLVPVIAGTALLARRYGWPAFAACAALALLTVSENRLGDDGGGALVLAGTFAVLAVLMCGGGIRALALGVLGAGVVVFGLLYVDAAVSGPDHLRGAFDGGVSGLASVAAHRIPLSYARVAEQWYLVFPLGAVAVLLLRSWRTEPSRDRRAILAAFGTALLASLLVNDSPGPVALGGLAAFVALAPFAVRNELAAARRALAAKGLQPAFSRSSPDP
jgi:hypothetical protein